MKHNCSCTNCTCTSDNHCGCLSAVDPQCTCDKSHPEQECRYHQKKPLPIQVEPGTDIMIGDPKASTTQPKHYEFPDDDVLKPHIGRNGPGFEFPPKD